MSSTSFALSITLTKVTLVNYVEEYATQFPDGN